jgi:hypothetical protein
VIAGIASGGALAEVQPGRRRAADEGSGDGEAA